MLVILSNQTEEHLARLKTHLETSRRPHAQKRLIVVQDPCIKSYLQIELTSHLFGIEILTVQQSVEKLLYLGQLPKRFEGYATTLDLYYSALSTKKPHSRQWVKKAALSGMYGHKENVDWQGSGLRFPTDDPLLGSDQRYEEVHLFAISSLCPFYHAFFMQLSQKTELFLWIISPCMMFWSDVCSDKEASRLLSRFGYELLYDRSPLLANCGLLGRDYAKLLDMSVDTLDEAYVVPEWLEVPRVDAVVKKNAADKDALHVLQSHILLLEGKGIQCPDDPSLQVHAAPTLLKEVEVLYESILQLGGPLLPLDCIILAPDIERYRPYIERVFTLPFQIYGTPSFKEGGPIQSFFQLFDLVASSYRADGLIQFFSNECVREKLGYEREDLILLKSAMSKLGFFWGIDQKMRAIHEGTLAAFVEKFMANWVGRLELLECSVTEAMRIASFIEHIRLLYASFGDIHAPKALAAWILLFEEIIKGYFAKDEEYDLLSTALIALKKYDADMQFLIADIKLLIEESVRAHAKRHDPIPSQPIVCSTLGNFRNHPARFIAILGLQEGYSFDCATELGASGTLQGVDKYLFLESVLSARSKLHLSFQSYSFEDKAPCNPSGMLTDLLQTATGTKITYHGLDRCVPAVPRPEPFFFHQSASKSGQVEIEISKLLQLARRPLQPYFQNTTGLYLFEDKDKRFDDDFKDIETLHFWKLKKEAFFLTDGECKAFFQRQFSHLPDPLRKACLAIGCDELASCKRGASILGAASPITICLSKRCDAPMQETAFTWTVPAICFDELGVTLTGTIEQQDAIGLLQFSKKSIDATVGMIPLQLIVAYLKTYYELKVTPDILFLEEAKRFSRDVDDPKDALMRYCKFYQAAQTTPLCLYPGWIQTLLSSEKAPEGFFEEAAGSATDRYLQFFLSKLTPAAFGERWGLWREFALDLYGDL